MPQLGAGDGGGGNDSIIGGPGLDVLIGGDGEDTLDGTSSKETGGEAQEADTLDGGLGSDTYIVGASDVIVSVGGESIAMRMRQYSTGLGSLRAGSKTEVVPG